MIVDLTKDHVPALLILAEAMRAEGVFKAYPLATERTEYILTELMEADGVFRRGVIVGGALIGAMLAEVTTDMWVDVQVARDIALYMLPQHRRNGWGVRLLIEFGKWTEGKADETVVSVFAGVDNKTMSYLLTRLGYRDAGSLHIMKGS